MSKQETKFWDVVSNYSTHINGNRCLAYMYLFLLPSTDNAISSITPIIAHDERYYKVSDLHNFYFPLQKQDNF